MLLSLSVAAALTGCGSSPRASGGPSHSTSASASATPPTKAQLKEMVVQRSDLGPSWKSSPEPPGNPKDDSVDGPIDKCIGVREPGNDVINGVDSQEFKRGAVTVHSTASSIRS